jgi:hypothetical protein
MISRGDTEKKEKKRRMNNVCGDSNIGGGDRPRSGQIWVAPSKERNSGIKTNKTIPVFVHEIGNSELEFPPKTGTFKILCDHCETFFSFGVKKYITRSRRGKAKILKDDG